MRKVKIINGPNLNMLGERESIYGKYSLEEIKSRTESVISQYGKFEISWFQSNIEGEIIGEIQKMAESNYTALIINPAGYSHTSVAIYDALKIIKLPIIEVHLTNVYAREEFRQELLTAKAASKIMSGLGSDAYIMALLSLIIENED